MQIYVYRLIWIVCATTGNIYATVENVSVDDVPRGGKNRHLKVENFWASICLRVYVMVLIPFVCLEMLEQACKLYNTSPRDISYVHLFEAGLCKAACFKIFHVHICVYCFQTNNDLIYYFIDQIRLGEHLSVKMTSNSLEHNYWQIMWLVEMW